MVSLINSTIHPRQALGKRVKFNQVPHIQGLYVNWSWILNCLHNNTPFQSLNHNLESNAINPTIQYQRENYIQVKKT